jgi:RimJ/RimL family protein N-acetyltransferase
MNLPVLQTPRLVLRAWTLDDAKDALAIYADWEVARFIGGQPHPDIDHTRQYLAAVIKRYEDWQFRFGSWALEDKVSTRVVGAALLKPLPGVSDVEIGWHLGRGFWGFGFATEAAHALLAYGFDDLDLREIFAVLRADNSASRAVTKRLGMTFMGKTSAYYNAELELYRKSPNDTLA